MTETAQPQSQVPEITVLNRVASIPLVASSIDQINSILEKSFLTRSPYHVAQAITHTAYNFSQPIQIRLAPLLVRADNFANQGLDVVESRFPYPFKAKPEEVSNYVREKGQNIVSSANKTFDKTVKSPARGAAEGIDKKFTPIVDYFELAVNKVGTESGSSSPSSTLSDSHYQYQRAINLSKHLKDNLYDYSSEHLKQLREQSVLVQRATETANNISSLASTQINNAQTRIHTLAENMLMELQKLQHSTAQLPQTLQATYPDISKTVTDLGGIVADHDLPVTEKVNRVTKEVKERVTPMLEKLTQRIGELLNILGSKKEEAKGTAQESAKNVQEATKPAQEAARHPQQSSRSAQRNASKTVQQTSRNVHGEAKNLNGPSSAQ